MWILIRFAFRRWRGQQQGLIERPPQTAGCLNVPAQICNRDKCDSTLIKNEGGMMGVANRDYNA